MNQFDHLGRDKNLPLYVKTKTARRRVSTGRFQYDLEEPVPLEGKVWYIGNSGGATRIVECDASGVQYQVPSRSILCSWPDHVYLRDPNTFESVLNELTEGDE